MNAMNDKLRKQIEKESPFFFELMEEIELLQEIGYDIERIYVSEEQRQQITNTKFLMRNAGLSDVFSKKDGEHYVNNIIINTFGERLGFIVLPQTNISYSCKFNNETDYVTSLINDRKIKIDFDTGEIYSKKTKKKYEVGITFTGFAYLDLKYYNQKRRILLHNLIYIAKNNKIPADHTIIHMDNNKLNNGINNLKAVTFSEKLKIIKKQNKSLNFDEDEGDE